MRRSRLTTLAVVTVLAASLLTGIAHTRALADDFGQSSGQTEIFPGDLTGPYHEQYLSAQSGSSTGADTPATGFGAGGDHTPTPYLTKRWADGNNFFSYAIPVPASTQAPLVLSMVTKGEVKLTVNGAVLLNTGNSGEGDYTPREFVLSDPAIWSSGTVTVRFDDADPTDGWGPNLYELELGPSSKLLDRLSHIRWGTSSVLWHVGLPDGTGNEFTGTTSDLTVGAAPYTSLRRDGTVRLRWNQTVAANTRYYLLAASIGRTPGSYNHVSGNDIVDVGDDGTYEINRPTAGEKVYEVDITNQVKPTGNVVRMTVPTGARFDFVAVVAVPTAPMDTSGLRVSFGGNEQADHFTALANTSMFFTLNMLNDKNSGFIDASPANGAYANSLFIADFGPAVQELAKFGYIDRVREALDYVRPDATGHYEQDIAGGNFLFDAMTSVLKADQYNATSKALYWPRLQGGMTRLEQLIDATPYHLVKGTNEETSAGSNGIYASATSYYTLLAAAEAADRLGEPAKASEWRTYAATLAAGIDTNLRWATDTTWLTHPVLKGTWKYGLLDDGTDPTYIRAGWQAVGSAKDAFLGLGTDDPQWRDVSNATLDHDMNSFWANWKSTGDNKGFGTDYGALSERGGWSLNSLLEADRIGDATKNLNHITFNSYDDNFAAAGPNTANTPDNNADFTEWSPDLIVRETDPQDKGSSANVGNGPGSEDLNLVEYMLFLKNARILAGVDDQLTGQDGLKLVPRLPLGWTTAAVNGWPVSVRSGNTFDRSAVSYHLATTATTATMTASTATPVNGVQVRLGPFKPTAKLASVTINGTDNTSGARLEVHGDSAWIWVTTNLTPTATTITAQVTDTLLTGQSNFTTMNGFTPAGGTWTNSNNQAHLSAPVNTDAWDVFTGGPTIGDGTVAADVRLESGNAEGISIRTNGTGSQGYDLILDRIDGAIKIVKRPYLILASVPVPVSLGRTYHLELTARGTTLTGSLDGVAAVTATDNTYTTGGSALYGYSSAVDYSNLTIRRAPLLEDTSPGTYVAGWRPTGGIWTNNIGRAEVDATAGNAWDINTLTATDSSYTANVRLTSGNAVGISSRLNASATQGYDLILDSVDGVVKIAKRPYLQLASAPLQIVPGRVYNLNLTAQGNTLTGYVDGQPLVTVQDSAYSNGQFGLFAYQSHALFDDVRAVSP